MQPIDNGLLRKCNPFILDTFFLYSQYSKTELVQYYYWSYMLCAYNTNEFCTYPVRDKIDNCSNWTVFYTHLNILHIYPWIQWNIQDAWNTVNISKSKQKKKLFCFVGLCCNMVCDSLSCKKKTKYLDFFLTLYLYY